MLEPRRPSIVRNPSALSSSSRRFSSSIAGGIQSSVDVVEQALEAIRQEMGPGHELSGSLRVKLARVAQDADASRLATELLT